MKVTKIETKYLIEDNPNKAEITVNYIKKSYSVYLRACKTNKWKDKVYDLAKKLLNESN